jgi:hypothetical protein
MMFSEIIVVFLRITRIPQMYSMDKKLNYLISRVMAPWRIITGFRLDVWIYWHLLLQSLVITINYNNSQSIFSRTLPWLLRTRSILVLRLIVQSQSYVTTDGQSASLSWNKAPIWGLRPDLYYCMTVAGLLMWGALSDERTGLSFARVTVSSSSSVVSMYNLHFTSYYMYIQYIQGLCQSRPHTADHAIRIKFYDFEGLMKSSGHFAPWELRQFS